jgi:GDP-L-fucose synthase
MDSNSKIFVAGHKGLVGSAIVRHLESNGHTNIITKTRNELDLTDTISVKKFFAEEKPEYVFLAAAKVGGIGGNADYPADFIYQNLMIQSNVIHSSYISGVKKLLFLGSSCIYPKFAEVPITEDQLLSGYLEPSNDSYAIAKIAGIKMCQAYRKQFGFNAVAAMPTNLYGPNDNFDHNYGHVLPSLISKFHGSKEKSEHWVVKLWGDGSPRREFLHVDDLASALYVIMDRYDDEEIINVGTGEDITIKELAEMIVDVTGYKNEYEWDTSKPNGTLRKVLDVDKMKSLGWEPEIELKEGLESTYEWYKQSIGYEEVVPEENLFTRFLNWMDQ